MKRSEKLNKLKDHFGGKCVICSEQRYWVLEFHHVNPRENSGRPAWSTVRDWSFDNIIKEYEEETVLLCRNCHGEEHYKMCVEISYHDD